MQRTKKRQGNLEEESYTVYTTPLKKSGLILKLQGTIAHI